MTLAVWFLFFYGLLRLCIDLFTLIKRIKNGRFIRLSIDR